MCNNEMHPLAKKEMNRLRGLVREADRLFGRLEEAERQAFDKEDRADFDSVLRKKVLEIVKEWREA